MARPAAPSVIAVAESGDAGRIGVLLDAALDLTAQYDLEALLARTVERAAEVADATYVALGLYDHDGRITRFVHHGMGERTVEGIGHPPEGRGLLGEAVTAEHAVRTDDIGSHPLSVGFPPGHPPMRTFLGVALASGERHHGNLYLADKHGGATFDACDEAMVTLLAAFGAAAIDRALLVEAEQSQVEAAAARTAMEVDTQARREILGRIIDAQEAERARVSRDLHDDVGQALTSVLLGLRLLEGSLGAPLRTAEVEDRIADLRELVGDALRRSRQLAFDLRPTVLDDIGLVAALERLVAEVRDRAGFPVDMEVKLPNGRRLPGPIETVSYRVVQEALTNVVRHANATLVKVVLEREANVFRVSVEDDGGGFAVVEQRSRLGLAGMKERAELVDGSVEITSTPGSGTRIELEVPLG